MAMEVVQEEMGDGNAQCTNHPYKNSTPGGICAFCLQEKLGKLVSSSFSVAFFPSSSSSSSSPSFRSESGGAALQVSLASSAANTQQIRGNAVNYNMRRSRLPFVKKNKDGVRMNGSDSSNIVFKRSKSTATPRRGMNMNMNYSADQDYSPHTHRRRFWSFLYMSKHSNVKKSSSDKHLNFTPTTTHCVVKSSREKKREDSYVMVDENESPNEASLERKVSRSRSVGCGSRSFSGDLFERISNGFGDCTLRRVESHREGKTKVQQQQDCIKERVKCGGIFSGFIITSSSSSSSSSSYLASEDKPVPSSSSSLSASYKQICHGKSRSWGWALAKPSAGKRAADSNKNVVTPNMAAIPSLLAVSGRA